MPWLVATSPSFGSCVFAMQAWFRGFCDCCRSSRGFNEVNSVTVDKAAESGKNSWEFHGVGTPWHCGKLRESSLFAWQASQSFTHRHTFTDAWLVNEWALLRSEWLADDFSSIHIVPSPPSNTPPMNRTTTEPSETLPSTRPHIRSITPRWWKNAPRSYQNIR